jgi:hypothetical protein
VSRERIGFDFPNGLPRSPVSYSVSIPVHAGDSAADTSIQPKVRTRVRAEDQFERLLLVLIPHKKRSQALPGSFKSDVRHGRDMPNILTMVARASNAD